MSEKTAIEWTDHTFNIAWGCMKVSPGCAHCYADTLSQRYGHDVWGPAATTSRRTFGAKHWAEPLKWNRNAEREGEKKRVFCSSMCDVFEDHPTIIAESKKLWPLIRATPWLEWQLLTKRPDRIPENLPDDWGEDGYANVWLGTSVETQEYADARIPALLEVPCRTHFLSCEPLLGPVSLSQAWRDFLAGWDVRPVHHFSCDGYNCNANCPEAEQFQTARIDWVIVGGESQPDARPMQEEWARDLQRQCETARVAFFLKQLGGHPNKRGHEQAVIDGKRYTEMPWHYSPTLGELRGVLA